MRELLHDVAAAAAKADDYHPRPRERTLISNDQRLTVEDVDVEASAPARSS